MRREYTNFAINIGDTVVPVSTHDQGREVCGDHGSMGLGVKLTAPRCPREEDLVIPAGTKLLSFVGVAIVPSHGTTEAIEYCYAHNIGGEEGYGILQGGQTDLIYDLARSAAYFVNSASATMKWRPDKKPVANMKIQRSPARAHRWLAWLVTKKALQLGEMLFVPYGSGAKHYEEIRSKAAAREARAPKGIAKKREKEAQRKLQLEKARAAKRTAKRAA